ncbi:protein lifeguard 2a [Latimeria chalumnae]|uniref:Fas apoptotic inhibitory molecule 2a n=1 Tax=Latimeria chalumnae TaxID=7897 RepID=H3ACW5_LATCH|nr:PREDICTED: protein lifeguard 2-like [Latimeria chalumnae]XP_014350592.1 PREDICTED: protein lifeguard 2-like [Latimeria chalumnae]XP_014350593.1 PREDICTED: protein lifeguard 2-like [Latimeria chalumnae]XP_014350594.1 PREDICTED: protein lifeguard 2-like [Latimeria chalumnae]|eukprot:XP_006006956.1 PREDICTED: protein lifeguard 2-like [Latimeria chalumnae]
MSLPTAPPTYAEAMAGTKDQPYPAQPCTTQQPLPPPPPAVPIHPSWAFVHPNPSPGYSNPYGADMYSPYSDPSSSGSCDGFTVENWDDKNIRRMFIRKVYTILMVQLMMTFGVVAVFTFCEPVRLYVQYNRALYFASYAIFLSTYLALVCCSGVRRRYPWNLILLSVFTLAMSYMAGMLASYHNTKSVMLCIGITAMVCLCVTLFCFQTKFDFTSCHGLMFAVMMALFLTGLVMVFTVPFGYIPWLQTVYAGLGALAFTLFLAYDTQLLIGNRRYSLSPEEHVFGALCLYMDIVYIFIFLLQLFGSRE